MRMRRIIVMSFFLMIYMYANAQIRLPHLISDGMILQRDVPVKLWGWASPHEKIVCIFKGKTYKTTTNAGGEWRIQLAPQKAGGPYTLEFKASNTLVIKNVLFGDVWVCSGQSNMEHTVESVLDKYAGEIAQTDYPEIRQFKVPDAYNFDHPEQDVSGGNWVSADPKTVLDFSAVAYFFAKRIYDKYKIPIGIVNTSLGGSPVEAWLSKEALKQFPTDLGEAEKYKDKDLIAKTEAHDNAVNAAWYRQLNASDAGLKQNWSDPSLKDDDWQTMSVPGYWADQGLGFMNGVVWFRKKIIVPDRFVNKNAKLVLGRMVDADSVFVNGKYVGNTTYLYPRRRYAVAAGILHRGENEISIRVVNNSGKGGFVPDKHYALVVGKDSLNLAGLWKYKLGAVMPPLAGSTFIRWKPEGLYNSMLAPLLNYVIKGVVWYQGESNADNASEYSSKLNTLIKSWRAAWQENDFPFIVVQLPNFMQQKHFPSESGWAMVRQAQLNTLQLPNTGVAVTIGLGEWNDVHPLDKKDVGDRVALQAEHLAYGAEDLVYSGPVFQSVEKENNKLILSFTNEGSGLMAKGGDSLCYFSIAGADKKFVWAKAKIEADKVVVWNDAISNPVYVRYAWADNPLGANLYNVEGLPASPFEADVHSK